MLNLSFSECGRHAKPHTSWVLLWLVVLCPFWTHVWIKAFTLQGHIHIKCKYYTVNQQCNSFSEGGRFFWAFRQQQKASTNHVVWKGHHVTTPNDNDKPVDCLYSDRTGIVHSLRLSTLFYKLKAIKRRRQRLSLGAESRKSNKHKRRSLSPPFFWRDRPV